MIRGTTAYFKFVMPYKYDELSTARIVFWQENYNGPTPTRPLPIVKTLPYCAQGDNQNELSVSLNAEETSRFTDKRKAYMQLTATTIEGVRFASPQSLVMVYPGKDVNDDILPPPDDSGFIILDGEYI